MSDQTLSGVTRPHKLRSFVVGRYGYLFLAAVVALLLIVGDGSKSTTPGVAVIFAGSRGVSWRKCNVTERAFASQPNAFSRRSSVFTA